MEGELVRMISMMVAVFTDLGLYLVGSLIICVRLRASSLVCRMAGVLKPVGTRGQYFHFCKKKHSRFKRKRDILSGQDARICI